MTAAFHALLRATGAVNVRKGNELESGPPRYHGRVSRTSASAFVRLADRGVGWRSSSRREQDGGNGREAGNYSGDCDHTEWSAGTGDDGRSDSGDGRGSKGEGNPTGAGFGARTK